METGGDSAWSAERRREPKMRVESASRRVTSMMTRHNHVIAGAIALRAKLVRLRQVGEKLVARGTFTLLATAALTGLNVSRAYADDLSVAIAYQPMTATGCRPGCPFASRKLFYLSGHSAPCLARTIIPTK
jgi:hypothetical protein